MEEFRYGIDQSNPQGSPERYQAQRRALWASFQYFLDRADWFILHYWPPQKAVQTLLDMGFEPEPTYVSPKARQVQGALTPEIRTLLRGPGEGDVPWFKVELKRDGEWLYYIEEHEDTAAWNCAEAQLPEVFAAGVDPAVVLDLVEVRRRAEARRPVYRGLECLAQAAAHLVEGSTVYGYGTSGESSGDRETAHLHVGRSGKVWLDFAPEAAAGVQDQETAQALLGGLTPPLEAGDELRLDLVDGERVLTRTGRRPEPAPEPVGPEIALARRRMRAWFDLVRPMEARVVGARPYTDFQFFTVVTRQMEIRLDGEAIASLTVEPEALDLLMEHPDPGSLLADAPAPAHLIVEQVGGSVRWRLRDSP